MTGTISPLLTDFYQLTMMGGYFQRQHHLVETAFEYLFRSLPGEFGFAVFAGLEDLADRVTSLRFTEKDIDYLDGLGMFQKEFLKALKDFRFTGDIEAVPEGTVVFPHEPIVRVTGPLWEAQLLETLLLNSLNYPTLVASKAARICLIAAPDPVLEFGLRRAQGPDGGLTGSRAAFIGGCAGTSNVEAGRCYAIPVKGTHAHSWIMSYPDELTAFRAYCQAFPEAPILLVDTFDTIKCGVPNAIKTFKEMRNAGWQGRPGIRLDSGDLAAESIAAYEMFTKAGMDDPLIVASNELDENLIADLKRQGARINAWGVGTHLITGSTSPALSGIYKLAAVKEEGGWISKIKISDNPEKTTDPGVKEIVRYQCKGKFYGDILYALDEEALLKGPVRGVDRTLFYRKRTWEADAMGEKILSPLFRKGRRITGNPPPLEEVRARARSQIQSLPVECLRLRNPDYYPVVLSEGLADTKARMLKSHSRRCGGSG
ncbi:MAG: nicotinate phosphoribosyltransferase [Planctomycetota bacterium]